MQSKGGKQSFMGGEGREKNLFQRGRGLLVGDCDKASYNTYQCNQQSSYACFLHRSHI